MSDPNILLVTVDCLRRDRLSAYGYERPTTPFLDSMLDSSLHCTSAHSVSSWTCPAVCSILTGRYPSNHGGGIVPGSPKNLSKDNLPTQLPDEVPTLAEALAARGYATGAIAAVWNAHLSIPGRFSQMRMIEQPAQRLVAHAIDWIRNQTTSWFLWVHLGDAHEPLDVPRNMRDIFGPYPSVRRARRWAYTKRTDDVDNGAFLDYRKARIQLYDIAVRSADTAIGRLWATIQGEAGPTVATVTSDHGEEFWEHRDDELEGFTDPRDVYGTGHGHNLFQVHILVPLLMFGAGIHPRAINHNVSLADVTPTIMSIVGDETPLVVDGASLFELPEHRPIRAEAIAYGYEKRTVVVDDEKLLLGPEDGYRRAFQLGNDRREFLTIDDAGVADRLQGYARGKVSRLGTQIATTDEISAHLRDLGYIE